jgi:hypothetical protein
MWQNVAGSQNRTLWNATTMSAFTKLSVPNSVLLDFLWLWIRCLKLDRTCRRFTGATTAHASWILSRNSAVLLDGHLSSDTTGKEQMAWSVEKVVATGPIHCADNNMTRGGHHTYANLQLGLHEMAVTYYGTESPQYHCNISQATWWFEIWFHGENQQLRDD